MNPSPISTVRSLKLRSSTKKRRFLGSQDQSLLGNNIDRWNSSPIPLKYPASKSDSYASLGHEEVNIPPTRTKKQNQKIRQVEPFKHHQIISIQLDNLPDKGLFHENF